MAAFEKGSIISWASEEASEEEDLDRSQLIDAVHDYSELNAEADQHDDHDDDDGDDCNDQIKLHIKGRKLMKLPVHRRTSLDHSFSALTAHHVEPYNPAAPLPPPGHYNSSSQASFLSQAGHKKSSDLEADFRSGIISNKGTHKNKNGTCEKQKLLKELSIQKPAAVQQQQLPHQYAAAGRRNASRVCRHCDREFPSGRALGGHMRVHGASYSTSAETTPAIAMDDKTPELNHRMRISPKSSSSNLLARAESSSLRSRSYSKKEVVCGSELSQTGAMEVAAALLSRSLVETREDQEEKDSFSSADNNEEDEASDDDQFVMKEDEDGDQHEHMITRACMSKTGKASAEEEEELGGGREEEEPLAGNLGRLFSNSCNPGYGGKINTSLTEKRNPLYGLRRNPKPSLRLANQEIALNAAATMAKGSDQITAWEQEGRRTSPVCSECGKVFWSWKALFGHMRCHPEREWRGIQRPEHGSLTELMHLGNGRSSSLELESCASELQTSKEATEHLQADQAATSLISAEAEVEASNAQKRIATTNMKTGIGKQGGGGGGGRESCSEAKLRFHGGKRSTEASLKETEVTGDWSPCWPTGKRSKRRRARVNFLHLTSTPDHQPALTSETTSNHQKEHDPEALKDQEDLDMANCLVLLSSASHVRPLQATDRDITDSAEESAFSNPFGKKYPSPEEELRQPLAAADGSSDAEELVRGYDLGGVPPMGKYECSTCNRCFSSHQALGGHRASHRKTKGCFARMNFPEEVRESSGSITKAQEKVMNSELNQWQVNRIATEYSGKQENRATSSTVPYRSEKVVTEKKSKGHECTICNRVFPTGQALGGHKRCHWTGERMADAVSLVSSNQRQTSLQEMEEWGGGCTTGETRKSNDGAIDLNLPAPLDEEDEGALDERPGYGRLADAIKIETGVGSLLDCHRGSFDGSEESSWGQANRELEAAGCRFDVRNGVWINQQWTSEITPVPQVCAMQPL